MTLTTASASSLLTPEQVADLVVRPVMEQSVAAQVSTVINISTHDLRIPLVTQDPVSAWVAEAAEIPVSEQGISEILVSPKKLAGLSLISRELSNDTSPEAARIVGDGLSRDIARRLDEAYFGNVTVNGPSGLGSLVATTVAAGAAWGNTDAFAEAIAGAENAFSVLSSFVANPADALLLAKVKKATGSNEPLLGNDPTQPTARQILGLPLYVSTAVTAGTIWGIPKARSLVVVRQDATVEASDQAFYTSDRVAIKATMRVGLAFPAPLAIVKISLTG